MADVMGSNGIIRGKWDLAGGSSVGHIPSDSSGIFVGLIH